MVQTNFFIDPQITDGVGLSSQLNAFKDALHSTHLGTTEPAYKREGLLWYNGTVLQIYNGSSWQAVSQETTPSLFRGTFQTGIAYAVGELVMFESSMYVCETVPTATEFTATDWKKLGGSKSNYLTTSETANATYSATLDNLTLEEGTTIYLRIYLTNTGGANIELNGVVYDILKDENKPLQTGDLKTDSIVGVVYNGVAFVLISNVITGFRGAFQVGESYNAGDFVVFENALYACTTDTTTTDFEVADWQASGQPAVDGGDGANGGGGDITFVSGEDVLFDGVGFNDFPPNKVFYNTAEVTIPYEPIIDFMVQPHYGFSTYWGNTQDSNQSDLGIRFPYDMSDYTYTPPPRITAYPNHVWHDFIDTSSLTNAEASTLVIKYMYMEGMGRVQDSSSHWTSIYQPLSNSMFDMIYERTEFSGSYNEKFAQSGYPPSFGDLYMRVERPGSPRYLAGNRNYFTYNTYGESLGFGEFTTNFVTTTGFYKRLWHRIGQYTYYSIPTTSEYLKADTRTVDGVEEVISFLMRTKGEFQISNGMLQVKITAIDWFDNKTETQARFLTEGEMQPDTYIEYSNLYNANFIIPPKRINQEMRDLQALIDMDDGTDITDTYQLGSFQFRGKFYRANGRTISQGLHYKDENGTHRTVPR